MQSPSLSTLVSFVPLVVNSFVFPKFKLARRADRRFGSRFAGAVLGLAFFPDFFDHFRASAVGSSVPPKP